MQAWPYYAYYPCAAHQCGWQVSVFFHIPQDLMIPCRGCEAALAWVSVSMGEDAEGRENNMDRERKKEKKLAERGRWGWWKIKSILVWLPLAREVYLLFLQDLVEGGKDKGWAKETLRLSLHWVLIYLCPIPGNPCYRRLEAKASN